MARKISPANLGRSARLLFYILHNDKSMKRNQITKQNTLIKLAVNPDGRLIDATKDVTEQDTVRLQYHKLQSEQFDPLTVFEPKKTVASYFISLSVLILFFTFAYLILT